MRTAGVRELKNRLSRYLRLVSAGETVLVTDHGRVVAQLGPATPASVPGRTPEKEALERLERAGKLRLGKGLPPSASPEATLPSPRRRLDVRAALEAVRADRS